MNMRKYASYKQAAKRIVRLMGENRGLKKNAGIWFAPSGNDAARRDSKGKEKLPGGLGKSFIDPYGYADTIVYEDPEVGTLKRVSVPRWNTAPLPEAKGSWNPIFNMLGPIMSTERQGLDRGPVAYQPTAFTFDPGLSKDYTKAVKDKDVTNKDLAEYWGKRLSDRDYAPVLLHPDTKLPMPRIYLNPNEKSLPTTQWGNKANSSNELFAVKPIPTIPGASNNSNRPLPKINLPKTQK